MGKILTLRCYQCQVEAGWVCDPYGPIDSILAAQPHVACTIDSTCNNEVLDGAEECDDGNNVNYDGCTADCKIEFGFTCEETIIAGETYSNCTEICGDGLVMGLSGCDDNNTINGDGCNEECAVEAGF